MALRLLVNTALLAIPIGGSVGTLLGIDAHRSATGQPPLFTSDGNSNTGSGSGSGSDSTGGGSGGTGSTTNNGVTNTQYCESSYGISPPTDGQLYTRKFAFQSTLREIRIVAPLSAQQLSSRPVYSNLGGFETNTCNSQSQPVGCDRHNFGRAMHECEYIP